MTKWASLGREWQSQRAITKKALCWVPNECKHHTETCRGETVLQITHRHPVLHFIPPTGSGSNCCLSSFPSPASVAFSPGLSLASELATIKCHAVGRGTRCWGNLISPGKAVLLLLLSSHPSLPSHFLENHVASCGTTGQTKVRRRESRLM